MKQVGIGNVAVEKDSVLLLDRISLQNEAGKLDIGLLGFY